MPTSVQTHSRSLIQNERPSSNTMHLATGKFFTQRLSSVVGTVRDRLIVQVVASHVATEKDVLVVYGGSHFATQHPALEVLTGKPVKWDAGSYPGAPAPDPR